MESPNKLHPKNVLKFIQGHILIVDRIHLPVTRKTQVLRKCKKGSSSTNPPSAYSPHSGQSPALPAMLWSSSRKVPLNLPCLEISNPARTDKESNMRSIHPIFGRRTFAPGGFCLPLCRVPNRILLHKVHTEPKALIPTGILRSSWDIFTKI